MERFQNCLRHPAAALVATALFTFAFTSCEKTATDSETASVAQADAATAPQKNQHAEQNPAKAEAAQECGEGEDCAEGCNQWDEAAAKVIERGVPDEAVWTNVKVSGMTCGGCERRVIAKVGTLDGVLGVEADAELGQVRLALASGKQDTAKAAAVAEIKGLGYTVDAP